uniref:Uncharacterized protein n=1 Tax=Picea sitchensis TaxID=3332 RepID=A9P092_PICSI|nr:unknown [Picea sitchensis]
MITIRIGITKRLMMVYQERLKVMAVKVGMARQRRM